VVRPVSRTGPVAAGPATAVDSLCRVRSTEGTHGMWTSGRAVSLHVALVIFIPACVALTWWQVSRALGGNTLSWVYTFEWPIFGVYAAYMWWKLVHDEPVPTESRHDEAAPDEAAPDGPVPTGPPAEGVGAESGTGHHDGDDDELAAYNRYLADLNASGRQKRW
jgi:hypothetical protein